MIPGDYELDELVDKYTPQAKRLQKEIGISGAIILAGKLITKGLTEVAKAIIAVRDQMIRTAGS